MSRELCPALAWPGYVSSSILMMSGAYCGVLMSGVLLFDFLMGLRPRVVYLYEKA